MTTRHVVSGPGQAGEPAVPPREQATSCGAAVDRLLLPLRSESLGHGRHWTGPSRVMASTVFERTCVNYGTEADHPGGAADGCRNGVGGCCLPATRETSGGQHCRA